MRVEFTAWAEQVLPRKYGDYLALVLGALTYPLDVTDRLELPTLPNASAASLALTVEPVTPLRVRQETAPWHRSPSTTVVPVIRELHTIGHLTAHLVDGRGQVVGGYIGAVPLP